MIPPEFGAMVSALFTTRNRTETQIMALILEKNVLKSTVI